MTNHYRPLLSYLDYVMLTLWMSLLHVMALSHSVFQVSLSESVVELLANLIESLGVMVE